MEEPTSETLLTLSPPELLELLKKRVKQQDADLAWDKEKIEALHRRISDLETRYEKLLEDYSDLIDESEDKSRTISKMEGRRFNGG